jgi:hypothetical protein
MESMEREERMAIAAIPAALVAAAILGWAGSTGGGTIFGFPTFAALYALAFVIQWVVFVPSYILQSERFFDITGSLTYISVVTLAAAWSAHVNARSALLLGLVIESCRVRSLFLAFLTPGRGMARSLRIEPARSEGRSCSNTDFMAPTAGNRRTGRRDPSTPSLSSATRPCASGRADLRS